MAGTLLHGLALLALLVAAGVLGLASWAAAPSALPVARRLGAWLTAAAALLLLGDAIAWAGYAPGGGPAPAALLALPETAPGAIVAARLVLVLLALWAAGLARRTGLGATFALAAVAVGSALGHPAALHPFLAVPLEAVHLLAVAAWLGGVVLLLLSLADAGGCVAAAGRVSALALASTVAVGLSGVLLALLFLGRPAELVQTDYGRLVLAKGAGLAVLVAFGALHRARFIPRLRGGDARPIGRALRLELGVFTLVVLVSGLLAHAPLPVRSPPTPERLLPPPAVRVGQPGGGR